MINNCALWLWLTYAGQYYHILRFFCFLHFLRYSHKHTIFEYSVSIREINHICGWRQLFFSKPISISVSKPLPFNQLPYITRKYIRFCPALNVHLNVFLWHIDTRHAITHTRQSVFISINQLENRSKPKLKFVFRLQLIQSNDLLFSKLFNGNGNKYWRIRQFLWLSKIFHQTEQSFCHVKVN